MGLRDDRRIKLLLAGFLLSLVALVAVGAFGLLAALSALVSPAYADAPLLFALLDATAPYLVASLLLGGVSFVLLVALSVAAVRRASIPRDARLARLARHLERYFSDVRALGLSERFEPTTEDRIEELKREYVAGEISEYEYEQRLQELLDEERASGEEGVSDEWIRRGLNRSAPEYER